MKELIDPFVYGGATFRVGLVQSDAKREACFRLRFDSYCRAKHPLDNKRFDPANYPDGLEYGPEDAYSHHFIATREEDGKIEPVGTFRLIPCERGFYVEGTRFGGARIRLPDVHEGRPVAKQTTYEAGRWVGHWVTARQGKRRVLVSMMLLEAGMRFTQQEGHTHWFCVIDTVNAARLRQTGWILDPLIPGVHSYLDVPSEACLMPMLDYNFYCPRLGSLLAA